MAKAKKSDKVLLSDLKLFEDNPRVISPADLEKLKRSLDEFPKMMSLRGIVVDKNNVIIGGNQRYKGLIGLGYTEIPKEWVQMADNFTEEEIKRFIIADNVGFGNFDFEAVVADYDLGDLADYGVEVPKHYQFGNEEAHIPDPKGNYETQHAVIVMCDDVAQQKSVYDELKSQGYNLKIVST